MPSTTTRSRFGSTRRTRPDLPRSLPESTLTVSSLRIFIAMSLQDLRSQRDDLHEVAVPELACHRTEDTRAAGVVLGVDQHRCVLVEGDVGAVVAAELLLGPDDDRLDHLALTDAAVGDRLLDGPHDHVADTRVAAPGAAGHADAEDLAGTGVVGDLEARFLLNHYRALSRTSSSRQRLVRLSGRVSTTRTVSPTCA